MKLAIIGGGGFRVPQILEALVGTGVETVVLHDVERSRLETMLNVASQRGIDLPLSATTDLVEAVSGADLVFTAMRIGGTCGRVTDEREALSRGVLGQETVGAGGYAYALRTVPVSLEVARAIKEHAPNAWTINFTNPAGIITQAMRTVLGTRVIGICDTPIGLVRRVAAMIGTTEAEIDYDYIGLNHLGWLRSVTAGGEEKMGEILAHEKLSSLEEATAIGTEWIRTLGMIPNEYLYYYYRARESRETITNGTTRGEYLDAQQTEFYRNAGADPDRANEEWNRAHDAREATYMAESREEGQDRSEADIAAGGYAEVAVSVMMALMGGTPARLILGLGNSDAGDPLIPSLSPDAVIEVPAMVDAAGVHPIRQAPLTGAELGLVTIVKACEEEILRACETGDVTAAWRALAKHPLVDSVDVAKELLDAYIDAHHLDLS